MGLPGSVVVRGTITVNGGRGGGGVSPMKRRDTRVQHTQTHTNTQIRKQRCFQVTQNVLQKQRMCEEGSGTPAGTQVMEGGRRGEE